MATVTRTTLKYMGVKESITLDKPKLLAISQKLQQEANKYGDENFAEDLFKNAGFSDDILDVFVNDPQLSGKQEVVFGKVDKAAADLEDALTAAASWLEEAANKIG